MSDKPNIWHPNLPENQKGKVIGFYAPKGLLENIEKALLYTGVSMSVFLRDAVTDYTAKVIAAYAGEAKP